MNHDRTLIIARALQSALNISDGPVCVFETTGELNAKNQEYRIDASFFSLDERGYHDTRQDFTVRIPIKTSCPARDFKITWSRHDGAIKDPRYADMKYIRQFIHGTVYQLLARIDYETARTR